MDDLRGMPITIVGAGAIGGTVGAFLADAGYDVTLVDVVPEHVEAINARGLRITGVRGDHVFHPRAVLSDDLRGPLGVVFLCVKGHFTERVMPWLAPLLAPDGYIVSLQNGLNEAVIARFVGAERTVGAFVHFGADYLEPGLIQLGAEQTIFVGELDGRTTPRVEALRATLAHVMPARVTDTIGGFLWGKLVYGAVAFAVSCVDATVPAVLDDPRGKCIALRAAQEAYRVAKTQAGVLMPIGEFDPNAFIPGDDADARGNAALSTLADAMRASVKQHMGIWRDLRIKRRQTEVGMQIGVIVVVGAAQGIATPVNSAVRDMIAAIERGERGMGWENLDALLDASAS